MKGKYAMNNCNFFSFLSATLLFGSVNAMDIQKPTELDKNPAQNSSEVVTSINNGLSYAIKSPYTQANEIIRQGAVFLGSRDGIIGAIGTVSGTVGGNFNPNNINDASPIALVYWKDLKNLQSQNQYFNVAIRSLQDRSVFSAWKDNDLIPCVVALNGYNVSIRNSYVSLTPLDQKLSSYEGSVFYRNLNENVSNSIRYDALLDVLSDVIGKPSEDFSTIKEVFNAALDRNLEERTDKFFNSELTAYFYKKLGLIDSTINCSNVIPAELSSNNGFKDILSNIATRTDTILKMSVAPAYGGCCLIM